MPRCRLTSGLAFLAPQPLSFGRRLHADRATGLVQVACSRITVLAAVVLCSRRLLSWSRRGGLRLLLPPAGHTRRRIRTRSGARIFHQYLWCLGKGTAVASRPMGIVEGQRACAVDPGYARASWPPGLYLAPSPSCRRGLAAGMGWFRPRRHDPVLSTLPHWGPGPALWLFTRARCTPTDPLLEHGGADPHFRVHVPACSATFRSRRAPPASLPSPLRGRCAAAVSLY